MSALKNANALLAEGECGKSNTTSEAKSTPIRPRVKALIVRIAVAGLIPLWLTDGHFKCMACGAKGGDR